MSFRSMYLWLRKKIVLPCSIVAKEEAWLIGFSTTKWEMGNFSDKNFGEKIGTNPLGPLLVLPVYTVLHFQEFVNSNVLENHEWQRKKIPCMKDCPHQNGWSRFIGWCPNHYPKYILAVTYMSGIMAAKLMTRLCHTLLLVHYAICCFHA